MNLVATRAWSMLLMPSSLLLLAIIVGFLLMLRAWRRGRSLRDSRGVCWFTGLSVALLFTASTPLAARWAAWTLERNYPPVDAKSLVVADAIVVLGGSFYATQSDAGFTYLYVRHASDRFERGLQAFQAGRAPIIIFGGGATGVPNTPSEGEWNRTRAVERGVPADRAFAGAVALYTTDESESIASILREHGCKRVILCTTAVHLQRAEEVFRNQGFEVTALGCDYATRGSAEEWSWALLIPRGVALSQTDSCAKEWMGYWARQSKKD